MKYLDEYRSEALAQKIVGEIRRTVTRPWVLMEVCGGQTHTIVKYGIDHSAACRDRACARAGMPGVRHLA